MRLIGEELKRMGPPGGRIAVGHQPGVSGRHDRVGQTVDQQQRG